MSGEPVELVIGGLTCVSCAIRIEKKLNTLIVAAAIAFSFVFVASSSLQLRRLLPVKGSIISASQTRGTRRARAGVYDRKETLS